MADITNINLRVPGVNSATNYLRQRAYTVDFATLSGIAAVGTHDIIKLPKGEALQALRVVAIESAASGGAATLQFKIAFNGTAANVNSTAVAVAGLAKGMVQNMPVTGIKAVDSEYEGVLQMVVGSAAYTGGKFLLIVETLPAEAFVTNG
jgi:hypothetical protein